MRTIQCDAHPDHPLELVDPPPPAAADPAALAMLAPGAPLETPPLAFATLPCIMDRKSPVVVAVVPPLPVMALME